MSNKTLTQSWFNSHSFVQTRVFSKEKKKSGLLNMHAALFSPRYELPQPSAAQKNDLGAWQDAVDNSRAQLEHQAGRYVHARARVQCTHMYRKWACVESFWGHC